MKSSTKYKTVSEHTYKFADNADCTVYIRYHGEKIIDGVQIEDAYGSHILIKETGSHYVVMGHSGKEISLLKEDCAKIPWYI